MLESEDGILQSGCLRVSIAVKGQCDHRNSYKGKDLIGTGLSFRSLVHYLYGSVQAKIGLEKELRVLYLVL